MDMEFLIRKMEKYADEKGIPIMEKDGIRFLTEFIKLNKVKNILEIGSAIGYSAICMANVSDDVTITSIERDKDRYIEAVKNVKNANLDHRITLVLADALEFKTNEKFDLIFIDAAKSQYIKFFEKFENNLKKGGVIVSDNLNFHGLTHTKEPIESRNVRGLVRKLNLYIDFLKENTKFNTQFYEIGDGVSISMKL